MKLHQIGKIKAIHQWWRENIAMRPIARSFRETLIKFASFLFVQAIFSC